MNIYVSGGIAPNIEKYDNHRIQYIPYEDWLSKLNNDSPNDIVIWQYQYPWHNEERNCLLSFEVMDEWCIQQQVIIDLIKKEKKAIFVFNQENVSISDALKKILDPAGAGSESLFPENKNSDIDKHFLSLISVWGESYWNIIKKLERLSFLPNDIKQVRRKKFAAKHKEILEYWLNFLSSTRQLHNENIALKNKISQRVDELAKLTAMLENAHVAISAEKQKNTTITSMMDANSAELITVIQQLKERDCRVSDVQKKYEILQGQYEKAKDLFNNKNAILENKIKENNSKIDGHLEEINLQKQEIANLKNEINIQKEKNEKVNNKCSFLVAEIEANKQSINNRYSELAAITSMLEASKREAINLREQLAAANEKNIEIKNSISWRATAPIRALRHPTKLKKDKKIKKIEETINLIKRSNLFDAQWYLEQNPDVRDSKIDPARHYLLFGGFERRDPSTNFSSQGYLELYPDVKERGINPLEHYIRYGVLEERTVVKAIDLK